MPLKSIAAISMLLLQVFIGTSQNRPDMLFIMLDDLRPELGSVGNKNIKTPSMDKIAASGIPFRNHYVQIPTCGASRRSLLTGTVLGYVWDRQTSLCALTRYSGKGMGIDYVSSNRRLKAWSGY